jgi:hypothetical protein
MADSRSVFVGSVEVQQQLWLVLVEVAALLAMVEQGGDS